MLYRALFSVCLCIVILCGSLGAVDVLIDAGIDTTSWRFHDGGEFPGAKGSLRPDQGDGLALAWDFAGGGSYVMATHQGPFPASVTGFSASIATTAACTLNWRLFDRSGRTFQAAGLVLAAGDARTVRIGRDGPWKSIWGGADGAALGQDIAGISLLVSRAAGPETPVAGIVRIQRLEATCAEPVVFPVTLLPVDVDLAGWRVRGQWVAQWGNPIFTGTVERNGGADGDLDITLPRLGRDWRLHQAITTDRQVVRFALPLAAGGNPHAIYRIAFAVSTGVRSAQQLVELVGARSAEASVGQPRKSMDLPAGAFGTCTHFSYGRNGAFAGWSEHESLLDLIAATGLTWIRDGVAVRKEPDGKFSVDPYDLGWLKLAKARGLKPIVVLAMNADQTPKECAAIAAAAATQVGDLASVFELGNEPNNFGGWIKTFGGTWNGREKDNSTSAWVKAHLASTNAAAAAIRAVRPKATIITLGAVAPTNFRAIDLGLSPAIDGVVDHPYAGCMPAERVPFSTGLVERDGVQVGDDIGSFVGLVRSYQDKLAESKRPRRLWITEFGWPTHVFNGENEKEHAAAFSEHAQAVYLARRWLLGLALGVPASCQYDFLDDYGSAPDHDEANFGMLRGDRSRKPSFMATQHLTALFNGQEADPAAHIEVTAKLPSSVQRGVLVKDWDGATFVADNGVQAWAFRDPRQPDVRTLAVWSAQPVSGEFSPRFATVRITGWKEMAGAPLAIDLLTGMCYDVPYVRDGDALVLKLNLGATPLAIRLFRN